MREDVDEVVGVQFDSWTALTRCGRDAVCHCRCGTLRVVAVQSLRAGVSRSCGCRAVDLGKGTLRHGHCRQGGETRLYRIWKAMRNRCSNPASADWRWYGGKGVTVCGEWATFEGFRDWATSAGYDDNLTIDRIDADGDYCPENSRWLTASENSRLAMQRRWS